MKIKVLETTPLQLDWLVANCEEYVVQTPERGQTYLYTKAFGNQFSPTTDWAQGGPIIEREKIKLDYTAQGLPFCWIDNMITGTTGPTPLIAGLRCYVASQLGHEVEVPEELT